MGVIEKVEYVFIEDCYWVYVWCQVLFLVVWVEFGNLIEYVVLVGLGIQVFGLLVVLCVLQQLCVKVVDMVYFGQVLCVGVVQFGVDLLMCVVYVGVFGQCECGLVVGEKGDGVFIDNVYFKLWCMVGD